jgi:hypothetical protein
MELLFSVKTARFLEGSILFVVWVQDAAAANRPSVVPRVELTVSVFTASPVEDSSRAAQSALQLARSLLNESAVAQYLSEERESLLRLGFD